MSDKKKYVINYFVGIIEFVTRFLWMFLAVPKITGTLPLEVYGMYMAVLSFSMFLSYADFGFMNAAYKYGCDQYLQDNKEREIEFLTGASFIQFIAFILFAIIMMIFAINPDWVIKGLTAEAKFLSRFMFILLAVFSFVAIPRLIISYIAQFRIELYRFKIGDIAANLINILLVYIILNSSHSISIIYYYCLSNVVMIIIIAIVGFFLFKKWHYSVRNFLSGFRFKKHVIRILWPFAQASFISTLLYIFYYEFDKLYIAKFLSAKELAFYIIGLTLMTFFRSMCAVLNSPYMPKYNRYYVNNDDKGMREFYLSHLSVVAPFIFIPVIVCTILMQQIIFSWVGESFEHSIVVAQILVASYIIAPLMDIASYIVTAKIKISAIYISSIFATVIFWVIVLLFSGVYGIVAVATAKFIATFISGIYIIIVAHCLVKEKFREYTWKVFMPVCLASIFAGIISFCFHGMVVSKSKLDLLEVLVTCGAISLVSLIFYIAISRQFRKAVGDDWFDVKKIREKILNLKLTYRIFVFLAKLWYFKQRR